MQYIQGPKAVGGCVLCAEASRERDEERFILYRGKWSFILLNLYPYNNGHIMVVPYEHTADLNELPVETLSEIMVLVRKSVNALNEAFAPAGFNIGMNLGRIAGAGIDDHVHMHVVPRWPGDTNFMPVLANTRTIPELLSETYERLLPFFVKPEE
jgi:ATP adenylyltransferase